MSDITNGWGEAIHKLTNSQLFQSDQVESKPTSHTKETLKALMADMERIEPSTWEGENIKRICICMVLEYMEVEE